MSKMLAALGSKGWGPTGSGPPPTDDLTHVTKDSVFLYQLQQPDPRALNEESLYVANICGKNPEQVPLRLDSEISLPQNVDQMGTETHHYARSVFHTCTKVGVIDAATGQPDTTKIDKSLVSKIGIISVPKHRELVNMLFWWEEELTRWRLLDEEEGEIVRSISARDNGAQDGKAELQERLRVIEAKRRVVPSLRRADGSLKAAEGQPPQYAP